MTYKEQFSGVWTALITPFSEDWSVDFDALDRLLDMQLEWEVAWVLFLWTTWESPTISQSEWIEIVNYWIKKLDGRCKVMVNIWTNSTAKSIHFLKKMEEIEWIDCYLAVNPYYNKPTQTGLFLHFSNIAKATSKPIFAYNIKWRTAVNLETETLVKLTEACPNIVWVKEASWDLEQMSNVIERTHDDFVVLSWDDGLWYELIKLWGNGIISVASNYIPWKMVDLVSSALSWDMGVAEQKEQELQQFFDWEFIQTNPLPIKTALAEAWIINDIYRLPMCPMDPEEKAKWLEILTQYQ